VKSLTVSFDRAVSAQERGGAERAVRAHGGTIVWRTSPRVQRSYGLITLPSDAAGPLDLGTEATVRDPAIIALALFPTVPEALPFLAEALGGAGRPSGVLACTPCAGGLVVEFDPARTSARTVLDLAGVELRRFGSGRSAELLAPLAPAALAAVAAEGLATPELTPDRELEALLEGAGLESTIDA
jgi:hypothetical protein